MENILNILNILSVDPGGDTGIAYYNYDRLEWQLNQISYKPIELYEFFMHWLHTNTDVKVICESFDYRAEGKYDFGGSKAIPKVDLTARNVIGILELACAYYHVDIVWQKPSCVNGDDGKKTKAPTVFWTDAKLKQLGLYQASLVHAMDAMKHTLYYRTFKLNEVNLLHALSPHRPGTSFKEEVVWNSK